jgi:hypothetical protein
MINQFLFLFFLEVLGLSFMVLFKKNLDRAYLYLLSFPMGVSLWAFLILIFLGAGVPVRRGAVLTASFLMLGVFFLMDLRKKAFSREERLPLAILLLSFAALSFVFLSLNYSFFTNDSWGLVAGGRTIALSTRLPARLLAETGIFSFILHSAGSFWHFDYLYALYPMIALFLVLFFIYGLYAPFGMKRISLNRHLAFSGLAALFLLSTFFILMNSAYIHTNLLYGFYTFIAVFGLWRRLQGDHSAWLVISILALLSSIFIRVEGPLVALIPVILLISARELSFKDKGIYVLSVTLAVSAWFLKLFFVFSGFTGKKLNADRSLFVILIYLLCLLGSWLSEKRGLARLRSYGPPAMLYALAFLWSYFIWTKGMSMKGGDLIIRRYGILLVNILRDGGWGITWMALFFLFIAALFMARFPQESLFTYTILSFGLLFNSLNLFRGGWRAGWGDSGNRMLVHIIFIMGFYIFLKFKVMIFKNETS